MQITFPKASNPFFLNELKELGNFFEEKVRPGCEFDLIHNPNPIWQIIQAEMLTGFDCFFNKKIDPNKVEMLQWYNSGVIIRSEEMSIGFDILPIPRYYNWKEPSNLSESIADKLDVLCVTHAHQDHFDPILVKKMLNIGKPVLMCSEAIPAEFADLSFVKCNNRERHKFFNTEIVSHKAFHVWRENINDVPLQYFEVSLSNKFNFIFSGDADYTKTFSKTLPEIDLLFLPWRNPNKNYEDGHPEQIGSTIDAIKVIEKTIGPKKIILEHYGELDHIYKGFSHSFDMAEKLVKESTTPTEIFFWGNQKTLK